jgi:endonuclease YncB( thermonuclease family)
MQHWKRIGLALAVWTLAACSLGTTATPAPTVSADLYTVVNVIDGDTIDVRKDGQEFRVRYIGVNTPERDETCYQEAKDANSALVRGQQVRLERDTSETDRYDRLLRFVYVGDTFVNETLVREGWAETVLYMPDDAQFENFRALEREAARGNRGCHPTGIFNDGNDER